MVKFLHGPTSTDENGETIFNGETFSDRVDLLTKIRDTLTDPDAGWTIVLDDISENNLLKLQGTDNGHNCYVNFLAEAVGGNTIDLKIQGDIDGTGRTRATDEEDEPGDERYIVQRVKANSGKLYIAASARSFVLMSKEKSNLSIPLFAGFPNRKDKNDPGAWMIGDLYWRMSNKYLANAKYVAGDWREIKEFYNSGNESETFSSSMQGCFEGTMDSTVNLFGASQTNSATQSAYKPENGSFDPDGKPVTEPFFLNQCLALQGAYSHVDDEATPAPRIGEIDFAVTGLASVPAGDQVIVRSSKSVTVGGTVYIQYFKRTYVAGSQTDKGSYQGFLIDEQTSDNPL